MVEFRFLGSAQIQAFGKDADALARQPKRLALLAYLALALPRGLQRRDKVVAMFWPELDAAHARNSLSQALHGIRSTLGPEAIVTRGEEEVGLGPTVTSDVVAFESAIDEGRPARALELYQGDLLDGFFVASAPEFAEWLENERSRLRHRACAAAWMLAEQDPISEEAERWARWAAKAQFPDEGAARRLMNFLHRRGNRSAAIHEYEDFVRKLESEYQLKPSADTLALAERIRVEQIPAAPPSISATKQSPAQPPSRRRAILATALALLGIAGAVGYRLSSASPSDVTPRLVVLPFENLGSVESAYLAASIGDEIATRLVSVRGLSVVSGAAASRYNDGAPRNAGGEPTYLLNGTVSWHADSAGRSKLRVLLRVVNVVDRATVWGGVFDDTIATTSDLFDLYSKIAQRVVEELDVVMTLADWTRGKAVPTRSLEAYNDYLRGREYHGRTPNAVNHLAAIQMLNRAVRRDSSFALAFAWLSIVHTNAHWLAGLERTHLDHARTAAARALQLDSSLADAHTSMAHYYYACCEDYERALWHLSRSIALRPGDWQSVMFKGNAYKRKGQWPEAIAHYQEAVQLNPLFRWPLDNLGHVQMWSRDYDAAERTFRRVLEHEPQDVFAHAHLAWLRVLRDGDTRRARQGLAEAAQVMEAGNDMRTQYYLELVDRRYDDALNALRAPAPPLTRSLLNEWLVSDALRRAIALRLKGDSTRARQYFDSVRVQLDSARRTPTAGDRRSQLWLRSGLAIAAAGLGRRAEAMEHIASVEAARPISVDAIEGPKHLQHVAYAHVLLNNHDAAIAVLERLLRVGAPVTAKSLALEPFWDPLRADPRFKRLLADHR